MKDIAQDLGVSVVTVSKVLRNHSDIGAETRERVLKRMKELNYQPNLAARALVTGKTYSIGLVVPDLTHPFFSQVAKGLTRVLRKKGYGLLIACSEEDPQLERQEIESLLSRRVDALVIASAQWTVESFRHIEERQTPYVLIDRSFLGLAANFVGIDDTGAGAMATEHLIEAGCKRVAHIRGTDISTAMGRLEGYRQALARHNRRVVPEYVVSAGQDDAGSEVWGYKAMKKLLALKERPDGVFCYNDPMALGAMEAIHEAGLRIPEEIAVIGCGNLLYSEHLRVPLSSVDQNSIEMGERAARLALSLLEAGVPPRPKTILLESKLIPRTSSARLVSRS